MLGSSRLGRRGQGVVDGGAQRRWLSRRVDEELRVHLSLHLPVHSHASFISVHGNMERHACLLPGEHVLVELDRRHVHILEEVSH